MSDSTRAASPVQQLVQALEPTPLEAAEMQARSEALRKDKSQGVFLADVEDRVRVAYDPAAATVRTTWPVGTSSCAKRA